MPFIFKRLLLSSFRPLPKYSFFAQSVCSVVLPPSPPFIALNGFPFEVYAFPIVAQTHTNKKPKYL